MTSDGIAVPRKAIHSQPLVAVEPLISRSDVRSLFASRKTPDTPEPSPNREKQDKTRSFE
jgi:hypothetical protein